MKKIKKNFSYTYKLRRRRRKEKMRKKISKSNTKIMKIYVKQHTNETHKQSHTGKAKLNY